MRTSLLEVVSLVLLSPRPCRGTTPCARGERCFLFEVFPNRKKSMTARVLRILKIALPAVLLCAGACTPKQYAQQADGVAYSVVRQGQQRALGQAGAFHVDYNPYGGDLLQSNQIRVGKVVIPVGFGVEEVTLSIQDCVQIALENSRSFQDRKEQLYLAALALGSSRRDWNWTLVQGTVQGEAEDVRTEGGGESSEFTSDNEISLTRRFAQGGVLVLAAGLNLATDLIGGADTVAGSTLEANFTQPLLRGAWRDLAYETQYRRERDFLFRVFEYDRFTQTFVADIFSRYYDVLEILDQLSNERENIARLEQTFELVKVQVQGGAVSPIQADQSESNLLDARIRLERLAQRYRDSLDSFKIRLGLPVRSQIKLEYPEALTRLKEQADQEGQLPPLPFDEEQAIEAAMTSRPEVMRSRAALRDADRNVQIAADDFLPRLDLDLGLEVPSTPTGQFSRMRFHELTRTARLRFRYPIDQTANRDAYRESLLDLQQARRQLDQLLDEVYLDVRQTYRELLRSSRTYEIRLRSVQIARRRRRLAVLQQKQGQASARDVLEAEEALREAQNGLTNAIVSYTTTRLRFLASLGMIGADEEGHIYERTDPTRFDRLAWRYPYLQPRTEAENDNDI